MPAASKPVVTRFAPSPTGELHVGGARTALYSWALARRHGGRFLLRFEDTDLARSSAAAADRIRADLAWFGLDWDNEGGVVPRQSERHAAGVYDAAVDTLLSAGRAYERDGAVLFRFGCDTAFEDAVYGCVETPASDNRDFVIRKGVAGGGMPTFHLAVVVDDHDAGVTHVVRGQEHLSNTPKHAALCDALGFDRPVWAHTPSILNPGGSKMSKRDKAKAARLGAAENPRQELVVPGVTPDALAAFLAKDNDDTAIATAIAAALDLALPAVEVADFRRAGYLPGVVANYVALLGWNPGDGRERLSMEEIARAFDLGRVNRANSTFDRAKLAAFSQDTLIAMEPAAFAAALRDHLAAYRAGFLAALGLEKIDAFAALYQQRAVTLDDPASAGRFFVEPPAAYDAKAVKKNLTRQDGAGLAHLAAARDALAGVETFDEARVQAALEALAAERELPHLGAIAQPLRVALTGTAVSPDIAATVALLGREEVLARIDRCVERFSGGGG
ncbi:glutamate--tRNA ligase [Phycisphaera mikurensis]|uniref:Glutamate--tRNA ligase n=1 Tax=Phycisphaera mikurensis (strain NBRC 102666 / KCTC 22515 / FYK2301M01) TaxID=1142394 RepID=I0IAH0_PHYMF|nr:glutamate--tRNA ligase family protein [Phycisphaera mikurensis]MBB6441745.1 glutamyl-tRNA synthetase [Phycisphaera mikurensis]BAM02258.1 putative glutamyl-tRNA synthetase [Phycisphaera mikurensis NBRC 102666]